MDNNASSHPSSHFNSFNPTEHLGRRRGDQLGSASQSPGPAQSSEREATRRNSNFSSPSPSTNISTHSGVGSTPQMPTNDVGLSLLQTLLKPQPPHSQAYSTSQSPMLVSDLERSFGHTPGSGSSAVPAASGQPEASRQANPMEQIRRMMSAQGGSASGSANASGNEAPANEILYFKQQQQQQVKPVGSPCPKSAAGTPLQTKSRAPSAYSSPRLGATTRVGNAIAISKISSIATTINGDGNDSVASTGSIPKKSKPSYLNIDAKKVKLKARLEAIPISLLQQPTRFRPGRLISVSRDYICYAVRSKEGGRIRVIHQLHGQLAKMQGHTDSIIDMAHAANPRVAGQGQPPDVWLVGPVDMEATSAEGAIAYEPPGLGNQIVDGMMELCIGTDKGFMVVRAPFLSQGIGFVPVSTDSAVTAIERAGLNWVIAATANTSICIYELSKQSDTSNSSCKLLCEVANCDQPVDTLIYVPPASKADGAGHIIPGSAMLLQYVSFVGVSPKTAAPFAKMSHNPSAIYVLRANLSGADMRLSYPHGYLWARNNPIYSVHSRLVQQLQISNIKAVEHEQLSIPRLFPEARLLAKPATSACHLSRRKTRAPSRFQLAGASTGSIFGTGAGICTTRTPCAACKAPHQQQINASAAAAELQAALSASLSSQIQTQISAAFADLQAKNDLRQANLSLSAESEAKLVERISTQVEGRVIQGMAAPCHGCDVEQMQSTFEAGLREWWMRFAQIMPPPPPPIATPLSHMAMMPQPQPQPQPQNVPQSLNNMLNEAQQQQLQQQQFGSHHSHAHNAPANMPMPHLASDMTYPATTVPGSTHLEAIMSLLNMQPGSFQPPQQQQQQHQHQQQQHQHQQQQHQQQRHQQQQPLMDSAIAALGQKTTAPNNSDNSQGFR
ncbi:hypothetical protein BX661DRAFT_200263 [Kickxella alabastrina]|uniref:uncharacterized protein n=1 Tax=Kickxella alabastrina TaxID=61397 RepID=UPI002220A6FE|nr:uncharacterized protein BX661DRAFT_200263 [Kickxella alabastrina]KAI7823163.1 hypothetical protein BX661DRAFT_200263 [Kickxella alabastrina]